MAVGRRVLSREEGPSSPSRDHRTSPDIQFMSDHEAGPSESVRRDASVPQSGSRVEASVIRLAMIKFS